MIDPVIFTIRIGGLQIPIRWYGVLIMLAVLVAAWLAEREIRRRGEDPEFIWDAMLLVLPVGILGARLWYVVNDILGGRTGFLENPLRIINIPEGGLHIYGALLFGGLAAYFYARRRKVDIWLILDSVAPSLLIGQALARPANFINQELYGPPTDLPWGISIDAEHRLAPWNDLSKFPVESTRFLKPGAIFAGWLVLAGLGRFVIENFRPDQPRIPGTVISYSRLVSGLMALFGGLWLLVKFQVIRLPLASVGTGE